jgi:hypothetical protein
MTPCDFLRFYPDGKYLYVEILAKEYMKNQPDTQEGMNKIASIIKPIVSDLERFCEAKNLKEITVVNLEGANLANVKPEYTMKLITLLHTERPDFKHLERIEIINANTQFEMLYGVLKMGLPGPVRKIVKLIPSP